MTAEPRGEAPRPPAPMTAEPRGEAPRPPAVERSPQPPAVPAAEDVTLAAEDDPAQTPAGVAPEPEPEPAGDQAGRQGRKTARGKRSSVPSWDEIMFGSSRQRD